MSKIDRITKYTKERGWAWTILYSIRYIILEVLSFVEYRLIKIEKRKFLIGPSTISSSSHTVAFNKRWDVRDWSKRGDEWTNDVRRYKNIDPEKWKKELIDNMMMRYLEKESTVLEIGPGAGRWTQILQLHAERLIITDISEKCLSICRERFKDCDNIEYNLNEGTSLDFVGDESIDFIWSYDVFVHINPTDTDKYLEHFARVLRPGGRAVVHHSGKYSNPEEARMALRSNIDRDFFAHLVKKHNLKMIEQNDTLPHIPGDVISVFEKPKE